MAHGNMVLDIIIKQFWISYFLEPYQITLNLLAQHR